MNNKKPANSAIVTEKRRIGNLGEDIACIYLEREGFKIKDRNYLRKYGELDIVAEKSGITRFIEVKTVSCGTKLTDGLDTYKPEDNIHLWKQKRLTRVIQAYILDKHVGDSWQFDVITVLLNMKTRRARISFMENIIL